MAFQEPSALATVQSVLAIPMKRFEQPLIGFLSREHMTAILDAPDRNSAIGQRDRVMLAMLYNTGARVSELTGMRVDDLELDPSASVRIRGKGRKERLTPLWPETAGQLKRWLKAYPRQPDQPLFSSRSGAPLTRVGVTERLKLAVKVAAEQYPELAKRRIFPHLIRHSIAMHMLQAGVDITVIALWLGHESPVTTHKYVEADLAMKERALKSLQELPQAPARYRPPDSVLQFLQSL
ncbi:tyrosine-type recombinase/integrase [Marinobacter sp. 1-3A]|uniref:tyrosine-type recombinase/integrase n=1 Tax=Marinobacter sp. 1-3A TaxID=2582920 RepID=UPI002A18A83A|nr:tyrosine-type recombinase/integrase [Marinobacter sp. 1-3A]